MAEKVAAEKARVLAELKLEADEKEKVDSMTIVEATEYMRTKDGKKAEEEAEVKAKADAEIAE